MIRTFIPCLVFIAAFSGLLWFEWFQPLVVTDTQRVKVARAGEETFEANDADESAFPQQPLLNDGSSLKWVQVFKTAIALEANPNYQNLDRIQQQAARVHLAKHLLVSSPLQSRELLIDLSAHERRALSADFTLAVAYSRLAQTEEAIHNYRQLLQHRPNHQAAAINLALIYKKQKQCDKALPVLAHARQTSSGEKLAKVLSMTASCQERNGELAKAETNYRVSIEYRPQHAGTWLGLARVQAKLDKPLAEVTQTFQRAIRLNPQHYKAHAELGEYQLAKLDFKSAVENLEKSHQLSPFQAKVRRNLAWAYFESGHLREARHAFLWLAKNEKSSLRKKLANFMLDLVAADNTRLSADYMAFEQLAGDLHNKPRLNAAFGYWSLLSQIQTGMRAPSTPTNMQYLSERSRWQLASFHYAQGDMQEAQRQTKLLLHTNVHPTQLTFRLSQIAAAQADFGQALEYANQALAQDPQNLDFAVHRLHMELAIGKLVNLDARLESLKSKGLGLSQLLTLQSRVYRSRGQFDKAAGTLKQLTQREPDDAQAFYQLAEVEWQRGQTLLARQYLVEALALDSELKAAQALLKTIDCNNAQPVACLGTKQAKTSVDSTNVQHITNTDNQVLK